MKILKFLSLITLLIAPANVLGAEISLQTSRSAIGLNDQFIVNVVVDTEESINAIEGQIEIPSSILRVINILDGDSIINFWVEKPTETSANTITFSGITPGGFKGNNKLFSLTLEATTSGSDIISFKNTAALLHDGLGTKTSLTGKDFIISVGQVNSTIRKEAITDTQPPETFIPTIEQNQNIFNNQFFLVFSTQDKDSGIDHYEVREGSWGNFKIATSPYLLENQKLTQDIFIAAIDKAGNKTTIKIDAPNPNDWWEDYQLLVIILVAVSIGIFFLFIWKKSKR